MTRHMTDPASADVVDGSTCPWCDSDYTEPCFVVLVAGDASNEWADFKVGPAMYYPHSERVSAYESGQEAAFERQQESLAETGGYATRPTARELATSMLYLR